jgi:hypothetical protein
MKKSNACRYMTEMQIITPRVAYKFPWLRIKLTLVLFHSDCVSPAILSEYVNSHTIDMKGIYWVEMHESIPSFNAHYD